MIKVGGNTEMGLTCKQPPQKEGHKEKPRRGKIFLQEGGGDIARSRAGLGFQGHWENPRRVRCGWGVVGGGGVSKKIFGSDCKQSKRTTH